ncbi:MAG: DUF2344 domain-containing protein [Chloroflexota bacterium]
MDVGPASAPEHPADEGIDASPPAVPRQRWRLVLARSADAPALAGRELADEWESALEATTLPLWAPPGRTRARMAFGAPIPARLTAERELADIVLTEVLPIWQVREELEGRSPDGWRLVDLHDVWLAGPALAGQVAAADYRIELGDADAEALAAAAAVLLAADALPRERTKGTSTVGYDLRPLLIDVAVADPGPPVSVRARTRFHPVLGTGRPEEVVAALSEAGEKPLVVGSVVRERLILVEDLA